jgi:hypothetical protein
MKIPTNAIILQCTDTRQSTTCFGTLKYHHQGDNHDPAEIIAQCFRNQRWMDIQTITPPATIYSFHPSLISTTLGTYLSRIMIVSLMMAF